MHELDLDLRSLFSRRALIAAAVFLAAVAAVAMTSHRFDDHVTTTLLRRERAHCVHHVRDFGDLHDLMRAHLLGGLDLLVRFRVRDHAHLRQLLLTEIFTINGVQRTETFLSLADVEPANFTASLLEQMSERRGGPRSEVSQ